MLKKLFSVLLFFITVPSGMIIAQEGLPPADTTRKNAIRLFIDCQTCDMNYIREEMPYINYVRDVKESQVYLLVTRQSTGSGGTGYSLLFEGEGEFAGMKDTLTYNSRPDDTQNTTRAGLTKVMSAGLMRYVAKTPIINEVNISYQGIRQESPEQLEDKWNYWVFELQTMPRFDLEKSVEMYSWTNSASANRITPEWKIENSFSQSYSKNTYIRDMYDFESGDMIEIRTEAIRSTWSYDNLTVKSLSDHWSIGFRGGVESSTYNNLDLKVNVAPAVEYDIFPYSQSNTKQLRVLYGIGYIYNNYIDTTIYEKTSENLFQQTLDIALQVQQSWGSANVSLGTSNYLHDFSKNQIELDGYIRLRLFKGFSLNINGSVAFIHDQIELEKGSVSDEDLYLRLRALETAYRYEGSVGITYTFGSIFNNIVNPRFGSGGGFGGGSGGSGGGMGAGYSGRGGFGG
ncbi:MAG: hypothetical protein JXB19_10840 [Bacteroidales bacterium]|nr:hypothetical protein [Bacteroidales bacterium]